MTIGRTRSSRYTRSNCGGSMENLKLALNAVDGRWPMIRLLTLKLMILITMLPTRRRIALELPLTVPLDGALLDTSYLYLVLESY